MPVCLCFCAELRGTALGERLRSLLLPSLYVPHAHAHPAGLNPPRLVAGFSAGLVFCKRPEFPFIFLFGQICSYFLVKTSLHLGQQSCISIMSRLFRHKSVSRKTVLPPGHPESGYSSLLESNVSPQSPPQHRRSKSSSSSWGHGFTIHQEVSRPWLGAAESRPSWTGERPPARKLVKEQNGSGRPSFSLELSDSDGEKEKGIVRRQFDRIRDLYRRDKSKVQPESDFL